MSHCRFRESPGPLQTNRLKVLCLLTAILGVPTSRAQWAGRLASKGGSLEKSDAKYNILAFGDSLTEGYYESGFRFHPYSIKLDQLLQSNGYSAKVYERGHSGELVVGGMDMRLPLLLQHFTRNGVQLNWVVILGGTNDLGYGADAPSIYAGLTSLYAACHDHGARVLALTVPEHAGSNGDVLDERTKLNELIRGMSYSHQGGHVTVLDLERQLPFPRSPDDTEAMALWDDALHPKPAGYDIMGEAVYYALKKQLEK